MRLNRRNAFISDNVKSMTIIVMIASLISACRKGDNKGLDASSNAVCKISRIIEHGTGDTIIITYDNLGRIISFSGTTSTSIYSYSTNKTVINKMVDGDFFSRTTFNLNKEGLPTNARTEYDQTGSQWVNIVYEYQGNELSKSTTTSSDGNAPVQAKYTWSNGDMISVSDGNEVTAFDYDISQPHRNGDYLSALQLLSSGLDIIKPKHLVTSMDGIQFSYSFSSEKNILSLSTQTGNASFKIYDYSYQCK